MFGRLETRKSLEGLSILSPGSAGDVRLTSILAMNLLFLSLFFARCRADQIPKAAGEIRRQ